jgi:hypothetical protein
VATDSTRGGEPPLPGCQGLGAFFWFHERSCLTVEQSTIVRIISAAHPVRRKRIALFSTFPMFVPSLSGQNDHSSNTIAQKRETVLLPALIHLQGPLHAKHRTDLLLLLALCSPRHDVG